MLALDFTDADCQGNSRLNVKIIELTRGGWYIAEKLKFVSNADLRMLFIDKFSGIHFH